MSKTTLPTTNLLAWIDERIADYEQIYKTSPIPVTIFNKLAEFRIVRNRIIQEQENEKAVINKAFVTGSQEGYAKKPFRNYYQETFNPNQDGE